MDANVKYEERRELIEIYNGLSQPLQERLSMIARVMYDTKEITLRENKKKRGNRKKMRLKVDAD